MSLSLLTRRASLMAKHESLLPKEYQQVEYIQSHTIRVLNDQGGTDEYLSTYQWINTEYYANYNTSIKCGIMRTSESIYYDPFTVPFGTNLGGTQAYQWYGTYGRVDYFGLGEENQHYLDIAPINKYFDIVKDKEKNYMNGVLVYSNVAKTSGNLSKPIGIFAQANNSELGFTKGTNFDGRIYYFNIYEGDTFYRKYVPCYRKSDNKAGLYDLCGSICSLTGTPFYIDAGLSTVEGNDFICGPKKG